MAAINRYGRKIQAPGPAGTAPGHIWDYSGNEWERALNAFGSAAAHAADKIMDARETAMVSARLAAFDDALVAAQLQTAQIGDPDERERTFASAIDVAAGKAMQSGDLRLASRTGLETGIRERVSRQRAQFQRMQVVDALKETQENLEYALQSAIRRGDAQGFREAADGGLASNTITQAKHKELLEQFPAEADIYSMRKQMDDLTRSDVPFHARIPFFEALGRKVDTLLQQNVTETQSAKLDRLKTEIIVQGREQARLQEVAEITRGRTAYSDMVRWRVSGGTRGKLHDLDELSNLFNSQQINKEAYDDCVAVYEQRKKEENIAFYNETQLIIDRVQRNHSTPEEGWIDLQPFLRKMPLEWREKVLDDFDREADAAWADQRSMAQATMKAAIKGSPLPESMWPKKNQPLILNDLQEEQVLAVANAMFNTRTRSEKIPFGDYNKTALDIAVKLRGFIGLLGPEKFFENYYTYKGAPDGEANAPTSEEPSTYDDFRRQVSILKASDPVKAKQYYDRWSVKYRGTP